VAAETVAVARSALAAKREEVRRGARAAEHGGTDNCDCLRGAAVSARRRMARTSVRVRECNRARRPGADGRRIARA
jgi:hypothetical protein